MRLAYDWLFYFKIMQTQQEEIWKDVPGYEGDYQASNLGRIKSLKKQKHLILKPTKNKNGYFYVNTCFKGIQKHIQVHKIIAITFLNHNTNGYKFVVDHKNNIKTDNRLCNLQIITSRENCSKDRTNKTSKYTGVRKSNSKWRATIVINNKGINLGTFDTEKEAYEYYKKAVFSINNNLEIEIKKHIYTSKYKGICFNKNKNQFCCRTTINNKRLFIGFFNTENEAKKAYDFFVKNFDNYDNLKKLRKFIKITLNQK